MTLKIQLELQFTRDRTYRHNLLQEYTVAVPSTIMEHPVTVTEEGGVQVIKRAENKD